MIADLIKRGLRGEIRPTPERIAWAMGILKGEGEGSFSRNFIDPATGVPPAPRAPVTGSSNFYCARTLAYKMSGEPEKVIEGRSRNAFWIGDAVHAMVKAQAVLFGAPVVYPKADGVEHVVSVVLAGDTIRGHVDLVVEIDGALIPVEIKSMSDYGFKKATSAIAKGKPGTENTFGYVDQLQVYIHAMGAPRGLFIGVNKSTGHIYDEWVAADPAAFRRIDASYAVAMEAAARGTLPARPPWASERVVRGNKNKPWTSELEHVRCEFCTHRASCWPGHEAVVVGNRARWRRPLSSDEVAAFKSSQKKTPDAIYG